jgi:hypothetical protein
MEPSFELRKKEMPVFREVAVLFHLRDAFVPEICNSLIRARWWLKQVLVPMIAALRKMQNWPCLPTHRIGWQTERRDSRSLLSGWPGLPVTALFRTVA